MLVAQRIFQLIDRDRQVRPVAEPRRDLRSETRLLQLLQQSADTAEIGLAKHLRQDVGEPPGPALPGHPPQGASQDASEYVAHENLLDPQYVWFNTQGGFAVPGPRASRPHSQPSGLRCPRREASRR